MGVSIKTTKVSSVIAALCILIYIAAIAFGAAQIVVNIGERRKVAEKEFGDLADRASSAAVFLGFMSQPYQETIKDYIGSTETLLAVIISGSGGENAFERVEGSGIIWAGDSPRFKIRGGFSGDPLYLPLRIDGQRNVTIKAIYSYIDYNSFIKVLRNVLLAILAALAIAFITLLLELAQKNKGSYYRSAAPGTEPDIKPGVMPDGAESLGFEPEPEPEAAQETAQSPDIPENEEFPAFSSAPAAAPDEEEPEIPAFEIPDFQEDEEQESEDSRENPKGLFTSRGNVGWESYLNDRLSFELQRCASLEQDLVLIIMELGGAIEIDDSLYLQFTGEAVNFFGMRDLIFEKGEKGISVIVPSVNLDHGIAKAEDFNVRINAKLSKSSGISPVLCIGLSSRSGRLIDAERLILEASKALEKALEDPVSPIVAFKSDPEKYREYVKTHSVKA